MFQIKDHKVRLITDCHSEAGFEKLRVSRRSALIGDPVQGNWGPADQTGTFIRRTQGPTNPPCSHTHRGNRTDGADEGVSERVYMRACGGGAPPGARLAEQNISPIDQRPSTSLSHPGRNRRRKQEEELEDVMLLV